MSTAAGELRSRNLRTLAGLAGLFLLPLLISFWMYYATDWRPAGHVNHGELLTPARQLPRVSLPVVQGDGAAAGGSRAALSRPGLFSHNWSLVYIGRGDCGDNCRHTLYVMRQTRLALNNDMTRVDRIFLVTGTCCDREFLAREHTGLVVLDASGPDATALLSAFPAQQRADTLFIVDPLGNLMMSYDARRDPKGLLQDLQKLLRLSHIG